MEDQLGKYLLIFINPKTYEHKYKLNYKYIIKI